MMKHNILAIVFSVFVLLGTMGAIFYVGVSPAYACSSGCTCVDSQRDRTIAHIRNEHTATRIFITEQFELHQNWLLGANGTTDSFFHGHVLPALMLMTEQLTTVAMQQMLILGSFFDAQIQLETQRIIQKKTAEAHKDYHPSFEMCVIGTNTRSLSAAQRNGDFTSFALGQRSIDRQLGTYTQAAAYSSSEDRESRLAQFRTRYCDRRDNNSVLTELCGVSANSLTVNKDIDFTRTVDSVKTLDIDFTDGTASSDERDIMALSSNLYNSDVLDKFSNSLAERESVENIYVDFRNVVAKRSVIENSFNKIVGLKSAGSAESENTIDFTQRVLEQLGITDINDRLTLLGGLEITSSGSGTTAAAARRPSYYAQMEILAQRIYQNPDFFISLYDKPANVARKDVAMQAIGLMLDRDMFESELRSEMVMSVMLELEIMKYQRDIQNRISGLVDQ